jgi:hypothetical protein
LLISSNNFHSIFTSFGVLEVICISVFISVPVCHIAVKMRIVDITQCVSSHNRPIRVSRRKEP